MGDSYHTGYQISFYQFCGLVVVVVVQAGLVYDVYVALAVDSTNSVGHDTGCGASLLQNKEERARKLRQNILLTQ